MAEISVQVDMRYTYVYFDGHQLDKRMPAGFEMVVAVLKYIEQNYNLLIGRNTADMAILQCRRDQNCTCYCVGDSWKRVFRGHLKSPQPKLF